MKHHATRFVRPLADTTAGSTFGFFFKVKRADNPGDYNGRPEEQSMDDDRIEGLIMAHGHEADNDLEAKDVPKSISDPPVEDTVAAPPERSEQKDHRYEETRRIADEVKEPGADSSKSAGASKEEQRRRSSTSKPPEDAELSEPWSAGSPGKSKRSPPTNAEVSQSPGEVSSELALRSKTNEQDGAKLTRHVLLVEDNAINQRIVNRKLQAKGFRVTSCQQRPGGCGGSLQRSEAFDWKRGCFRYHSDGSGDACTYAFDVIRHIC